MVHTKWLDINIEVSNVVHTTNVKIFSYHNLGVSVRKVVKLAGGGSATNGATLSSMYIYIFFFNVK